MTEERRVILALCYRCSLEWVYHEEEACPRCNRHSTRPNERIIVGGVPTQVEHTILFGDDAGLLDPRVRRGLAEIHLGERCEHGYMSFLLCPECNRE